MATLNVEQVAILSSYFLLNQAVAALHPIMISCAKSILYTIGGKTTIFLVLGSP